MRLAVVFLFLIAIVPAFGVVAHVNNTGGGSNNWGACIGLTPTNFGNDTTTPAGSCYPGTPSTGTFSYTPTATNDGVLFALECSIGIPPSVGPFVTLTAPGWSITQVGSVVSDGVTPSAIFRAYAPNTSAATFTEIWSLGTGACTGLSDLIDEWSGMDSTNFIDNTASILSSCSLMITPVANNTGLYGLCIDSVTGTGAGFSKGTDDTFGDWTEYKILSGGGGSAQMVNFMSSAEDLAIAITIKPATAVVANISVVVVGP